MSATNPQDASPSRIKLAAVVGFYMTAALVMVFVNKAVLISTPDLPLTFLFIQLALAVVLLHLASLVASGFPDSEYARKLELPSLSWSVSWKLLPVVSVNIIGLVFNTLCLRDVDASFFQIARGLLLPLTIAVSFVQTRLPPMRPVVRAAVLVTAGFFVGASPASLWSSSRTLPLDVTGLSLFYGCMSSLMIAVHAVLVKSAHSYVGNSSIKLAYFTNLGSAIALIPVIGLAGEVNALLERRASAGSQWLTFAVGSVVTGVFGFILCMAGLISIKTTSPVTHMFVSAARSVIQTILGVIIFKDIITSNRLFSICIITVGTLYFTWVKSLNSPSAGTDVEKQAGEHHG